MRRALISCAKTAFIGAACRRALLLSIGGCSLAKRFWSEYGLARAEDFEEEAIVNPTDFSWWLATTLSEEEHR